MAIHSTRAQYILQGGNTFCNVRIYSRGVQYISMGATYSTGRQYILQGGNIFYRVAIYSTEWQYILQGGNIFYWLQYFTGRLYILQGGYVLCMRAIYSTGWQFILQIGNTFYRVAINSRKAKGNNLFVKKENPDLKYKISKKMKSFWFYVLY